MPTPVVPSLRQPIRPAIAALAILLAAGCDRSSPAPPSLEPFPSPPNYIAPIVEANGREFTRTDLDAMTTWQYSSTPRVAANDNERCSEVLPLIDSLARLGVRQATISSTSINNLTGLDNESIPTISLAAPPTPMDPSEPPDQPIVVTIKSLGGDAVTIQLEGVPTPPATADELRIMLTSMLSGPDNPGAPYLPTDPVLVFPDADIPWGQCVAVADAARRAGYITITLSEAADRSRRQGEDALKDLPLVQ